ncbi:MAG: hypothetical protein COB04_17900 [Gammaproteobacteria bacterium]|nr:MAG: hypothetical protein COB04_17900 [Gammaproteobacteria bacterium]
MLTKKLISLCGLLIIINTSGCGGTEEEINQTAILISTSIASGDDDASLPAEISTLIVEVRDENNNLISSASTGTAGRNVRLTVNPNADLTVTVFARNETETFYEGGISVTPLLSQELRSVAITIQQSFSFTAQINATDVQPNETLKIDALAEGLSNNALSYFVNEIPGGNASIGTIDNTGVYTAPLNLSEETVVTVSAAPTVAPSFIEEFSVTIAFTEPPSLTISNRVATTKTIQFDWLAFPNATFYQLMANPDSQSGFSVIPDQAQLTGTSTTLELPVHLTDWLNARYRLEAHNATGKLVSSNELGISELLLESIGEQTASNADEKDSFGQSLSLSADGLTLAIGAFNEDSSAQGISSSSAQTANNNAINSGAAYVYTRTTTDATWTQQAYIKADNTEAGDQFAWSLSLSANGNTLAVGANRESSAAAKISATGSEQDSTHLTATDAGAAYLFVRSNQTWTQQAYIKASNTEAGDQFGWSISLSENGDTLAVGAIDEDGDPIEIISDQDVIEQQTFEKSGTVYVFIRQENTWLQHDTIKASNFGTADHFGASVSLSADGNTLAVGAESESSNSNSISTDGSGESDNTAPGAGAAYLFSRFDASWQQQAYIKASNSDENDNFGHQVALSANGKTLAVSANKEDSSVFGVNTNGSEEEDNESINSGAVYIFQLIDSVWNQQAYIKASNTEAEDNFGQSISLSESGRLLAVGANKEDSNATGASKNGEGESSNDLSSAGAAYVYSQNDAIWDQQTYVKGNNAETTLSLGSSISLSADGQTLVIGAHQSSNFTGSVLTY